MSRTGRTGWIECARAAGACGVVLLHVFVSTALACDLDVGRQETYAAIGIIFGRWAVPAFFMITGLLLLDPQKEVGWERAWGYARRMLLVLASFGLVFSLMEEVWVRLSAGDPVGVEVLPRAVLDVATANSWDHLWYVYALVPVYLLVPPLKALRARLGQRGFYAFTACLFVLVLVMPTCVRMETVLAGGTVELPMTGFVALACNVATGISCLCVGGCLQLQKARISPAVGIAGAVSLLCMLAAVHWGFQEAQADLGFVFLQGSCLACLYALLVLALFRDRVGTTPLREGSVVDLLARDSFGIYVLHPVFVHLALIALDPLSLPQGLFEAGLFAFALVGSVALTHAVRRLPLVGDLL